jgi:hypothetical protein
MSEHETITLAEMAVEMRLTIGQVKRLSNTSNRSFPKAITSRRGNIAATYSMGDFLAWKAQHGYKGNGIDKKLSLSFLTIKPVRMSHE